jgi:hypothetical protein
MMIGVKRSSRLSAPHHSPRFLKPLLGRVVAQLAERLPVALTPKQFPRSFDPLRIAAGLCIFQPGRNNVVNDGRGNRAQISRAHAAQRMLAKERIAGLLPPIAIPSGGAAGSIRTRHQLIFQT